MSEEYELAAHVCGVEDDADYDVIDDAVFEKFQISVEEFTEVALALLPLIDVGKSPLTNKTYKGFSTGNFFLLKVEA